MDKVAILADSLAGLPPELVRDYEIRVISDILTINGVNYRDMVDITPEKFWELFKSIKTYASSAPSPGDFVTFFRDAAKTTKSIIFISVSKQLSAVYNSASSARTMIKKEIPDLNIEVVDSKYSAGAMGFIVIEAARAAQAGKNMAEILQVIQDMIPRVKSICSMDTLKYIIRSGRAPKKAYIGELLGYKPLIGMVSANGLTDNLGTVKGKQNSFKRLVEMISEYTDVSKPLHVMVQYTNRIQDGEQLVEMVKAKYNCAEIYLTTYSPITCGHSGPINSISFYS
jgi:DegV family protein with EDD domain